MRPSACVYGEVISHTPAIDYMATLFPSLPIYLITYKQVCVLSFMDNITFFNISTHAIRDRYIYM